MVSVLGMGGIGKSALVTNAMRQLASHFQVVLFRSLRDAPECSALLEDCLHVLAPQLVDVGAADLERRLSLLLSELREQRVLLVLDNLEALLEAGEAKGRLRPGYEGYARLLQAVAQRGHQSGLLLTSREKPAVLRALESRQTTVRSLRLGGLEAAACEQLLVSHELLGSPEERARLIALYEGNPLALNIVAQTIADLFGGQISPFLSANTAIFGGIAELLGEQWSRLSPLEQSLLFWLAILREPVTLQELQAGLVAKLSPGQLLEAVDGLRRRSLIEQGQHAGSFTLQSVVLEYVTDRLVSTASQEIVQGQLSLLREHGLSQARAKDYVRQTQERLLLVPVLASLQRVGQSQAGVKGQLCELLDEVRELAEAVQGYSPANLVTLLRLLRGNLRGLNLSHLSLRGLYLQGVELQDANLAFALLRECLLTQSFDAITAVAISKSGQYWAAAGQRGEVRLWREEGQTLHLVWQAHRHNVWALAFSPDERTLASGSGDGSLKLWDVESGALLWSDWRTQTIVCLAFSPEGDLLASGGDDATLRLWDPKLGVPLQELPHPGSVASLAWSPDGRRLASGDVAGTIRLWELRKTRPATCVQTLSGHTNWVQALAFSPNGSVLASASFDRTVKLWEVESASVRQTLAGHTSMVMDATWSPNGRILASCGLDQTIWLWDVERGSSRTVLYGHTADVQQIAFTPDSRSLLSGSGDGTLRVWEMERGQCVRILQGYAVCFYDLDWSPDGIKIASAGTDRLVTIWEESDQMPPRLLRGHSWVVHGVAWSPHARLLASCGWDNAVRVWDATTGEARQIFRGLGDVDTVFSGVAWSPDGKFLASGTYQQGVYVWEVTTDTCLWHGQTDPAGWIRRVAWSPDGIRLAGGSDDGHVYVWDASDGTLLHRLQGHGGRVMSVAWSSDGTLLASGGGGQVQGGSGEIFVWQAHSGQRLRAWNESSGTVSALAWSASAAVLVSGGSEGTLCWWDVQWGQRLAMREGHQGVVQSLRVSPDRSKLASCGDDGTIRLWDLESGELLRTLRRDRPYERLNITGIRGLTQAEIATLRALGAVEDGKAASW